MQDLKILVAECAQSVAEKIPLPAKEDVDGYAAVAFPPPYIGQFNEDQLVLLGDHSTKIIDGGHCIVTILYYAHILHVGVETQRDERVFFS